MPHHHIEPDGTLVIPSITRWYQGKYISTVTSALGELEISDSVQIIVTGMCHINIANDVLHKNLNRVIFNTCQVPFQQQCICRASICILPRKPCILCRILS